jgi:hypothetical protein
LNLPCFPTNDNFIIISKWSSQFQYLNYDWISRKNQIKLRITNLFKESLQEFREVAKVLYQEGKSLTEKDKRELNIKRRKLETRIRSSVNKLLVLGFDQVWSEIVELICAPDSLVIRDLLDVIVALASQGQTDAIKQLWQFYQNSEEESSEYLRAVIIEALRFLPILELDDWQLIFTLATESKSDIEKLKATETWLYLGHLAQPFMQSQHLQNVVEALQSVPPPFTRLKKNYILILGMYNCDLPDNILLSDEEKNDYLIKDALKLAESGKVSEIFKEIEPARVRQYYNLKQAPVTKEKYYSL